MLPKITLLPPFVCFLAAVNAARILGIFPILAKSHFTCNHAILEGIHAAGHQITMIAPFSSEKKLDNFTYIHVSMDTAFNFIGHQSSIEEWADSTISDFIEMASTWDTQFCLRVLQLPEIQKILRTSEKLYDVLLAEHFMDMDCYLPIAEKLGIPVIATMTLHRYSLADHAIGIFNNPAVVPAEYHGASVEMSFMERIENLWNMLLIDYLWMRERRHVDEACRKYFPAELLNRKKVSLVFYNSHSSLLPRPAVPKAIEVGGIHVSPPKPLPTDLQKFIDEASNGVVLFSLGSVVRASSMTVERRQAFLSAFSSIPQRVIWKYEEQIEDLPKNVLTLKWLPQRDILEHKKVIAFMSHCGQSGVFEAVMTGTPVITIPLFSDQHTNAAMLHYRGVGVPLNYKTVTKESVLNALETVINDTSYYQRMQELSKVFKDRPMTPQQSVAYWTEYVLRHNGTQYLETLGTDMPVFKRLMLDIIAVALLALGLALFIIYVAVTRLYLLVVNRFQHAGHVKKII